MDIIQATKSFYGNYATFSGRTTRSEFWFAMLSGAILSITLWIIDEKLRWAFFVITLIPYLAIGWRRNNDVGVSGWWSILPFVNLYFFVQPSMNDAAVPKATKPEPAQDFYKYKEPAKVEQPQVEPIKIEPLKTALVEPIKAAPAPQPKAATIEQDDPSLALAVTGALLVVAFFISLA